MSRTVTGHSDLMSIPVYKLKSIESRSISEEDIIDMRENVHHEQAQFNRNKTFKSNN